MVKSAAKNSEHLVSKILRKEPAKSTRSFSQLTDYNKRKLIDINDNFSKELYKGVDLENE